MSRSGVSLRWFPSPYGVLVLKCMTTAKINMTVAGQFPSPYGVLVLK